MLLLEPFLLHNNLRNSTNYRTVKQQTHNVPVLNILMQSVSTLNNVKSNDSGPSFRGRALHDTMRDYDNIP